MTQNEEKIEEKTDLQLTSLQERRLREMFGGGKIEAVKDNISGTITIWIQAKEKSVPLVSMPTELPEHPMVTTPFNYTKLDEQVDTGKP